MTQLDIAIFDEVKDPREKIKVKHQLSDILCILVCAVISGAETYDDIELYGISKKEWLSQFLELKNGIPSHDTFRRIMMLIDPEEFEYIFLKWVQTHIKQANINSDHIAIDGKTMKGSYDHGKGLLPIHIVSAYSTKNRLVLSQKSVKDKSGEKSVLPALIKTLDLQDTLVSIDAGGCYIDIASQIHAQGGDYLLALKGNQKNIHTDVKRHFNKTVFENKTYDACLDAFDDSHGRRVRRRVFISEDMTQSPYLRAWPKPSALIAVETIRSQSHQDKVTSDIRYYISNSKRDHIDLAQSIRNHWSIENSVHWILDVTFNEDRSRVSRNLCKL